MVEQEIVYVRHVNKAWKRYPQDDSMIDSG